MAWVLTKGLAHLRDQVNDAFPDRDKASDGTVGDLAHQVGTSGHNPDRTGKAEYKDGDSLDEVRAWDMDSDLRMPGVTTQQLVDHIRDLPGVSSVLRYIIFNRKIYKASNGWKAETYTGPSPHTEHVHFSGAYSQAADNNTSYDYRLEALAMPITDADVAKLVTAFWNHEVGPSAAASDPAWLTLYNAGVRTNATTNKQMPALSTVVTQIAAQLKELTGKDFVDEGAITAGILAGLGAGSLDDAAASLRAALGTEKAAALGQLLAAA